jgi:class 3 adenylate cyclase
MPSLTLTKLLDDLDTRVREEFAAMPEVLEASLPLSIHKLPIEVRRWFRLTDVVAVVADLKDSTRLSTGKNAASTASIYEAATGSMCWVFDQFDADYVQVQGDGGFALFWGDLNYERAMCTAITIRTFSEDALTKRIEAKWPSAPETGFKVGVAAGRTLVKRIGVPRNYDIQEPVWSGNPVNFATKAAQCVGRHQIAVTGSVWDAIADNDYLVISCGCNGGQPGTAPSPLWKDFVIDRLGEDEPERDGRILEAKWCANCGEAFCSSVMQGSRTRDDVEAARAKDRADRMANALAVKSERARQRKRGLALVGR